MESDGADPRITRRDILQTVGDGPMSDSVNRPAVPRAVIHKRILDVAAEKPDASLEELADEFPSATPELVERVFDEYGDPADDDSSDDGDLPADQSDESVTTADDSAEPAAATPATSPETANDTADDQSEAEYETADLAPSHSESGLTVDDLTEKQRETLRAIYEYPNASQRDIADHLRKQRGLIRMPFITNMVGPGLVENPEMTAGFWVSRRPVEGRYSFRPLRAYPPPP